MDREQGSNDDQVAVKESSHYLWLAAFIVGGMLILMLLVIAGIILWKYLKKQNTADQNWAGPPPMTDGNIQEDGNFKTNECILGNMPHSCIRSSPKLPNEPKTSQDGYLGGEAIERKPADTATISTLSFSPTAPISQLSNQHLPENDINEETFPPPLPHILQEFPMPPQSDHFAETDLEGNPLQPLPLLNSSHQDEDSTPIALNHQTIPICEINISPNTDMLEDQLLPPPPADFFF
ncbi:protein EVI2B [Mixophyes fleayi]|uniref:protein EVI2B n=1 Tax=Mixophyes fleayi TaxID=3061075 RepID=UPI003F4E34EA